MINDFRQIELDEILVDDCRQLVRLAVREDLARGHDLTTVALVNAEARAKAHLVARQAGVACGLALCGDIAREMEADVDVQPTITDGTAVVTGEQMAELEGNARDLLTCERTLLNFVGRLSGVATNTRRYVDAAAATGATAGVYDTRKTTPGWRRLEMYAVRCGGGRNHRAGLYDAVLIKDNHLAYWSAKKRGLADAIKTARARAAESLRDSAASHGDDGGPIIAIEVDSLAHLREALPGRPDIALLDNMSLEHLYEAVKIRDMFAASQGHRCDLEASGGVTLGTIGGIALTGVDRISVGALTHSAVNFDASLDWP